MAPSNIGYALREALTHFRRNFGTCFGAVVTIFLSLFVIGMFITGSMMVEHLVGNVEDRVTIQAFLSDEADQAVVDALITKIQGWDNVESVTYKSKEEALEEYKSTMSNRNASDAIAALDGENPIPASIVIKLKDSQQVEACANQLIADADFAQVADGGAEEVSSAVSYGRETVERLFSVTRYIRIGAVVLVALLAFVSFVFINNTIRLAIGARRREIAIERLVGASNSFIRGPFVAEAMLEALFGGILAVIALEVSGNVVVSRLTSSLQFLDFTLDTGRVIMVYVAIVIVGLLLGLFGSAIAMRRYLKV